MAELDLVREGVLGVVEEDEDEMTGCGAKVEPLMEEVWIVSNRLDVGRVCIGMVMALELKVVVLLLWLLGVTSVFFGFMAGIEKSEDCRD